MRGPAISKRVAATVLALSFAGAALPADEEHHAHPVPEKLGSVSFATSCSSAVQPGFERALALLHSFSYAASEQAFRDVTGKDPGCAI
ncbi:MAG: hypothetical protein ABI859_11750, partial [Pseudomonadota bacterium]